MYKNLITDRGFTIVELLIVVVVVAILAVISLAGYSGITSQAEESSLKSELTQASKKIEMYKVANLDYPYGSAESALSAVGMSQRADLEYRYIEPVQPHGLYCLSVELGGDSYYISNSVSEPVRGSCGGNAATGSRLSCPVGFIRVPGDYRFGTSDFCVMKYEAKNNGSGVAVSQAAGSPWVSINQIDARQRSVEACSGCHLITESEWMTIAANVFSVPSNWSGGEVGSGYMWTGHAFSSPSSPVAASPDDSDVLFGITPIPSWRGPSPGNNDSRVLTLTNGEVIWDFSGNAGEWTQGEIIGQDQPIFSGSVGWKWSEWRDVADWVKLSESSRPSYVGAGEYTGYDNGIGSLYGNSPRNTTVRGFVRGGFYSEMYNAGVFSLRLSSASTSVYPTVGFRVTR